MADTTDLKSVALSGVRVRVPLSAPTKIDVFRHVDFCWVPLPLVAPPLLIMASQAEVNSA